MSKPIKPALLAGVPEEYRDNIEKAILHGLTEFMKRNGAVHSDDKSKARNAIYREVCGELTELGQYIIFQQEKGTTTGRVNDLEEELEHAKAQLTRCEKELGAALDTSMPDFSQIEGEGQ